MKSLKNIYSLRVPTTLSQGDNDKSMEGKRRWLSVPRDTVERYLRYLIKKENLSSKNISRSNHFSKDKRASLAADCPLFASDRTRPLISSLRGRKLQGGPFSSLPSLRRYLLDVSSSLSSIVREPPRSSHVNITEP